MVLAEHSARTVVRLLLGRDPDVVLLTRWHAEVEAKHAEEQHAEVEARAVPEPVVARSAPATTAYQAAAPS